MRRLSVPLKHPLSVAIRTSTTIAAVATLATSFFEFIFGFLGRDRGVAVTIMLKEPFPQNFPICDPCALNGLTSCATRLLGRLPTTRRARPALDRGFRLQLGGVRNQRNATGPDTRDGPSRAVSALNLGKH